jgi:hypothetical protein
MPAEILALGMATLAGLCTAQTAASVRAGIGRLVESHMPDVHGRMPGAEREARGGEDMQN